MTNRVQEPGLPYSFGAYQIKIRITDRPLLLVEGKDDKQFFDKFKILHTQRLFSIN